ncbi:hypothetical protein DH2020_031773 [Rehmannia glutinosa]|uniref:G-type lectin S-receptor-like serine/threonine-protein kinase n=1 Tax=Rehmannia glutinosa TaxID=99300 RepID=A0ABR0VJG7_REHGL
MNTLSKGFSLVLLTALIIQKIYGATDTINVTQNITDGESIVSSGGTFELGFFSPGNTNNRYVGMWYKNIAADKVVWVANREVPLTTNSGVLTVIHPGILVLLNDTNNILWSSNISKSVVNNPIAQLLDNGNLVVRDANNDRPENFIWQSFDYPTDTFLPGIKFGWNFITGVETYLSSWKNDEDPSPGDFTYHLDPTGYPQIVMRQNKVETYRIGPWNGLRFSGFPNMRADPTYTLTLTMNKNEVHYFEHTIDRSVVSSCHIGNSPACGCLNRFVPKDPEGWNRSDWSNGCVRRTNLSCQGDVFLRFSGIKLPDARHSWFNESMSLKECEAACLKNCSCMAYTALDFSRGSGCLLWFDDLVDIRTLSADGQDIYIRMASSELESQGEKREILIASLTSVMVMVLIGVSLIYLKRRKNDLKMRKEGKYSGSDQKDSELPLFKLSTILKATNYFSIDNKLGEGVTFGYMSPEYAVDGLFSVKSDVFSFGTLVLEIVSGKRNRGFSHSDHHLNLLGHAWTLYKEERSPEIIDATLADSIDLLEVLRSIHVGLLCVQKKPEDRPSMSSVVLMLGNEGVFPPANQPGFFTEREPFIAENSSKANAISSTNEVTITLLEAR